MIDFLDLGSSLPARAVILMLKQLNIVFTFLNVTLFVKYFT